MPEVDGRSPVALALARFRSQRSARVGLGVIIGFALLGIYAPFIASETAWVWWDDAGLRFPVLAELFNRLRYGERYDLFFNMLALAVPPVAVVAVVLRKRIAPARIVRWGLALTTLVWIAFQIPILPPQGEGTAWRAVWTNRPLATDTWGGYQQIDRLRSEGVASAARRRDLLRTSDGERVRVLFKTTRPVASDGSAIIDGSAPDAAARATFVVVRPDGQPRAEPRYLPPDQLEAVVPRLTLFPPVVHDYDTPYSGTVLVTPFTKNEQTGQRFWLGADASGQDIFARMLFGARISLTIGVVATVIAMSIGIFIGAVSGFFGGWIDIVLQRIVEIMMCFPSFLLILVIVAMVGRDIMVIIIVSGFTGWAGTARLVRGEFLSQSSREYVLACRAMGLPRWRIMFKHILPNALTPLFIAAAFSVAGMILAESGLSFLGLVDSRTPSWGLVLSGGRQNPEYWHIIYAPGLAIFALVSALNLVGNALREAFDPKGAA
ncbi:MAG: ABC transporter permease [Planctomycetota bacterium]|jgi:peptide/nickel transport system permease protein|nr:ABC transporter permease [Planctomycetota bacterium]